MSTAGGSGATSSRRARKRCATRCAAISTPSPTVDETEGGRRPSRGGALAVDLRRARAAQRRLERAEARAHAPPAPAPSRQRGYRVACTDRDPVDCVREWFALHGWTPFAFQEEVWRAYL